MQTTFILVYILSAAIVAHAQPQATYQPTDSLAVVSLLSRTQTLSVQTPAQRLTVVGRMLLDKPFGAKTLETSPERLVVNLRAFDCTTFLETVLALSQTAAASERDFAAYRERLAAIRYRNGQTHDYTARLHYLTDWLNEKIQRGELEDVTAKIGGRPYAKPINFMTKHPQLYPQLSDPRNLASMQAVEKQLGAQLYHKLYYIPKAEVAQTDTRLQEGDIIAITTGTAGLDVVHVGLAVRQNGRIHLLHASADQGKVAVSKLPLADYLQKNAKQTGIIVTRVKK